tara:strand:- start:1246 stop:1437 length:192 start_codon:yes stop_codon:yes gene_type:complete
MILDKIEVKVEVDTSRLVANLTSLIGREGADIHCDENMHDEYVKGFGHGFAEAIMSYIDIKTE